MTSRHGSRWVRSLLWGPFVAAALVAQGKAPVDPYTQGDAAALRQAGYVSLGPFPFGERHSSGDVEALLGDEPLCWVETAHFRIGVAVSPLSIRSGTAAWRRSVKRELGRLRERLPEVETSTRTLDPWLRTHLIAQRLEDCYAEIQRDFGVTDTDFLDAPMDPDGPAEEYYGKGPYLGMPEKFSVLIVRRVASCARYTRAYCGHETQDPLRLYFPGYDGFCACLAEETNERLLANDEALHTHLVYNVVVNLLNGYRSYGHDAPPWLVFGLAHWHARRICPRYPAYERAIDDRRVDSPFWEWNERALGLIRFDAFEPIDDLMKRSDVTRFELEQHIQAWFFVDYLMQFRKAETMRLLHVMKAPFHGKRQAPTRDEVIARQSAQFEDVFGLDLAAIEADWKKLARSQKRRK